MQELQERLVDNYSPAELVETFSALPSAPATELNGMYEGKIVSLFGVDLLPSELRSIILKALLLPINPWKGKTFKDGKGANVLLYSSGGIQYGHYKVKEGDAYDCSGKCLVIDYGVSENPALLQPIRGECKKMDDAYLCRMLYRTENDYITILYFTLTKTGG